MTSTLTNLIGRLADTRLRAAQVIQWGAPVPSFGDATNCTVATLGLNPSNREFVDEAGRELDGPKRRFHTLQSLGIVRWSDVSLHHVRLIRESCRRYFGRNPYDGWFKRLDDVIGGIASYYGGRSIACHLDLIPYATSCKWTMLTSLQRGTLMKVAQETLGALIRESAVRTLVLNGSGVVSNFKQISGVHLCTTPMTSWSLPRRDGTFVPGLAYSGIVREIAGVKLNRSVRVLGYNHNIQSSFGVTRQAIQAIRSWITDTAQSGLP